MRNAGIETPNVSGPREATAGAGTGAGRPAGVRGAVGADHAARQGVVARGMNTVRECSPGAPRKTTVFENDP